MEGASRTGVRAWKEVRTALLLVVGHPGEGGSLLAPWLCDTWERSGRRTGSVTGAPGFFCDGPRGRNPTMPGTWSVMDGRQDEIGTV
jgi:hypothetical protein